MILQFIKTHWFSIALIGLLLFALIRIRPLLQTSHKTQSIITSNEKSTAPEPAAMGLLAPLEKVQSETRKITQAEATAFINRFKSVAISEAKQYKIPASVILACAFVNSQAGLNNYASELNNYFAVPCTDDWDSATGEIKGQCFRKYETAWKSFRDFSL